MAKNILFCIAVTVFYCATFADAQWTPDPFCPYPSEVTRRFPYYGNCSVFWECFEGTKYIMECPEGMEFHAAVEECDAPEIAKCDPFAPTTGNPHPPTYSTDPTGTPWTPDPLCPYPSDEVIFFPVPGDCTKYYECFSGDKFTNQCPDGLWWHQAISECDYPGDYCDDGQTSTSTTNGDMTSQEMEDPRCVDGGVSYWPHPNDCSKYIECFDHKSYEMTCPPNLYFSNKSKKCVNKDETECCAVHVCE